jgi:hypothetical protein
MVPPAVKVLDRKDAMETATVNRRPLGVEGTVANPALEQQDVLG